MRSYTPSGVSPAVLLPFDDDLAIDEAAFRKHLRDVAAEHERAWSEGFDNKFDRRIGEERDTVFEIVAQALAQALDEERRNTRQELHDEVKALRTELAEVTTIVGELRQVIASE